MIEDKLSMLYRLLNDLIAELNLELHYGQDVYPVFKELKLFGE